MDIVNYEKLYKLQDNDFNRAFREIKSKLTEKFIVKEELASKDFIRLKIDNFLVKIYWQIR